jgi:hypothetical protein
MEQIVFKQDLNLVSIRRLLLRISKKYPKGELHCIFKNCYLTEIYLNEGELHNENGYAIRYKSDVRQNLYFLNGNGISKLEFFKFKAKNRIKQILRA